MALGIDSEEIYTSSGGQLKARARAKKKRPKKKEDTRTGTFTGGCLEQRF